MLAIGKEQRTESADSQSLLKQNIQMDSQLHIPHVIHYTINAYPQSVPKVLERNTNSFDLVKFGFEIERRL